MKKGRALPKDTEVYIYAENNRKLYALRVPVSLYPYLKFVFYSSDGLWASKNVREYWDYYPQRHPHCTLLGILFKNLQI